MLPNNYINKETKKLPKNLQSNQTNKYKYILSIIFAGSITAVTFCAIRTISTISILPGAFLNKEVRLIEGAEVIDVNGNKIIHMKGSKGKKLSGKNFIFFGGNGGSVTNYLLSDWMKEINNQGAEIFCLEYLNFGNSENINFAMLRINQEKFIEAIKGSFHHILEVYKIKPNDIIISGHSLGGCMAIYIAYYLFEITKQTPFAIILFSPMDDMKNACRKILEKLPILEYGASFFAKIVPKISRLNFNATEKLSQLIKESKSKIKIYAVSGDENDFLSLESSEELVNLLRENHCRVVIKSDTEHNDTQKMASGIIKFIETCFSKT
jgi:predicted esterase